LRTIPSAAIWWPRRRDLVAAAPRLRVDREPVAMPDLDTLAARYDLTLYGAAYLGLALRRALPLATQDKALSAAMATAGVTVPSLAD
jgi:hypothetical protein